MIGADQIVDDIDFSTAVVYDYDITGILRFYYTKMKLTIWDFISVFQSKQELTLRISGHDPRFLMPSMATVTLQLNFSPFNGQVTVTPLSEDQLAVVNEYLIQIRDVFDLDTPLTYKYNLYASHDDHA